jgi:dodecin
MENMAVQSYSTPLSVAMPELRSVRTRADKFHRDKRRFFISLCARLHKHFSQGSLNKLIEGNIMATKDKSTESVYRVTEVIGTSSQSWEDAAKAAVKTAAGTLRDLRIAEVVKMDVKIENGKVLEFRTRLQLSFKYQG